MGSKKDSRPKGSSDKSQAKKARKVGIQDVPGGLGVKRRERSDDADSEGPGGTPPTSDATASPAKKKNKTDRAARALKCGVSLKEISKDEQARTTPSWHRRELTTQMQDSDEAFEDDAVPVPVSHPPPHTIPIPSSRPITTFGPSVANRCNNRACGLTKRCKPQPLSLSRQVNRGHRTGARRRS
jgi:hypothetical protein